jgi:hypothetical protein
VAEVPLLLRYVLLLDLPGNGAKAFDGLRPPFSAHVRSCESRGTRPISLDVVEQQSVVKRPISEALESASEPKRAPQISPLRCAPVEMTILFEDGILCLQEEYEISSATTLSSRPERSVVERSAVLFSPRLRPLRFGKTCELSELCELNQLLVSCPLEIRSNSGR